MSGIINKEEFLAKARMIGPLNNPGLKSGIIDYELIVDFSPKPDLLILPQEPGSST